MEDMDKLRHLLGHWIEHNDGHLETYREWASKAREAGRNDVADVLEEIARETEALGDLFSKAEGLMA